MPSKRVHVTFDDSKRIISYDEDEKVDGLRHLFLRVFCDVLSDDVAPAHVKFQKYDDTFQEYIDLGNGQKVEENARLKVVVTSSKGKKNSQAHSGGHDDTSADRSHCHPLCTIVIPWYHLNGGSQPSFPPDIKFHPIKKDVPYRIWNIVSNGLIHEDGSKVTCSGDFKGGAHYLVQAKSVGNNEFHLVFNGDGSSNDYKYITSEGEGNQVVVKSSPTNESVFVPDYYWGQTVFRSKPYSYLYLGTDSHKKATLLPMEDPLYPNPQVLFVVNKYNPPT